MIEDNLKTITVEDNHHKLSIEFKYIDATLDDLKLAFKTILVFMTFSKDLIDEMFMEE